METAEISSTVNALWETQDFQQAKSLLVSKFGQNPEDADNCYRLAVCHLRLEEYVKALHYFTRAGELGAEAYHDHMAPRQFAESLKQMATYSSYETNETKLQALHGCFHQIARQFNCLASFSETSLGALEEANLPMLELKRFFAEFAFIETPENIYGKLRNISDITVLNAFVETNREVLGQNIEGYLVFYLQTLVAPVFTLATRDHKTQFLKISFVIFITHRRYGHILAAVTTQLFQQALHEDECGLMEAMAIYEVLYGYYWMDAVYLSDMAKFSHQVALPFNRYLKERFPQPKGEVGTLLLQKDGPKLAMLIHHAFDGGGNAVAPHLFSLLDEHAKRGQSAIVYCVQHFDPSFVEKIRFLGHTVKTINGYSSLEAMQQIRQEISEDKPEVLMTEMTSSIAAYLFHCRVAPIQVWLEMGFPYWDSQELDWVFMAHKKWRGDFSFRQEKSSPLRLRQSLESINKPVSDGRVDIVRKNYPTGTRILGCFTRYSKITSAFLELVEGILKENPDTHLIMAGTGDTAKIREFIITSPVRAQFTMFSHNVDIQLYGRAIDVFLDTFPFPGGNSCREVMSFGKPVVSKISNDWPLLISESRDPELVATDKVEYQNIVGKLLNDTEFYAIKRDYALAFVSEETAVSHTYDEIMMRLRALNEQKVANPT